MRKLTLLHTAKKWLLLFSLCFATHNLCIASSPLTPELAPVSAAGFRALYQMDYIRAKQSFERMIQMDTRHPAGYVHLASAIWLERLSGMRRLQTQLYNRGNAFFRGFQDPVDPATEKRFYATVQKGIVRAELRLKSNPADLAGLYYLGSAHGAIAGYESTIQRNFRSSLKHGTSAAEAHKKILERYPDFQDAYLTVGFYNYVLGTLPASAKLLMLLTGVHGSKGEGLRQLELAHKNGRLVRDEAAALLAILYDREQRPANSLNVLNELAKRYPSNPVFRFESATMLTKLGRITESKRIYEKLMGEPVARDYLLDFIQFEYAELLFASGNWQNAYMQYLNARRVRQDTPVGLITMTHLRAGQCLNAMGRNNEAALEYDYVLKQPEIQGSRTLARQYLKRPYQLIPYK